MAPSAPCWLQIPSADVKRASEFYKNTLGFNIDESRDSDGMEVISFNFQGTSVGDAITGGFVKLPADLMNNHKPMGGSVYYNVDDMEGTIEKINAAGGRSTYPRRQIPHGYISGFVDTEGNAHGLYTVNGPK